MKDLRTIGRFRAELLLLLAALSLLFFRCNGDDPAAHIDCFGGYWCQDGVVTEELIGPVPLSEKRCKHVEAHRCEQGCRVPSAPPEVAPEELCGEYSPPADGAVADGQPELGTPDGSME